MFIRGTSFSRLDFVCLVYFVVNRRAHLPTTKDTKHTKVAPRIEQEQAKATEVARDLRFPGDSLFTFSTVNLNSQRQATGVLFQGRVPESDRDCWTLQATSVDA